MEPIPAVKGHHMVNKEIQPISLTYTPKANIESPINLHAFELWEEAKVSTDWIQTCNLLVVK